MALRIGVVGLGLRGRQWVEAIRRDPAWELAAGVDTSAAARREAATALAIPAERCFEHLEEALDAARPQAVIVATTIDDHVTPSQTVLARRIPLLVEKPFALTLREARALTATAAAGQIPVVVGQTYRYTGMGQTLKRVLQAGVVGRTGLVVYQVYRGDRFLRPAVAAMRYGVLWETAVHHLDLLRYVLGQEIIAVTAEGFALPWSQLPHGGSMQIALTFADGTRGLLLTTYDARPASALRIVGERGTLIPWRRWLLLTGRGRLPRLAGVAPHAVPEAALLAQLARAVETGEEPECSARDNLQTVAALEACARSAAGQQSVNPQALFDEPA